MANAVIAFSGNNPDIATYELTQVGPLNPASTSAPPLAVVSTIKVGENTFVFKSPTAPGDYIYSVQAYDANHAPVTGPQSVKVTLSAPPVLVDNIPASISVTLGDAPAAAASPAAADAPHVMGY